MSGHPDHYTELLQRQLANDSTLTRRQQRELDLHLSVCLPCNMVILDWLQQQAPNLANDARSRLWEKMQQDSDLLSRLRLQEALAAWRKP